eukprot:m.276485 g.276485  ORF g.276485 m.276485 type:complete len:483 (+) comp16144_c0_seq2:2831-4279(+)
MSYAAAAGGKPSGGGGSGNFRMQPDSRPSQGGRNKTVAAAPSSPAKKPKSSPPKAVAAAIGPSRPGDWTCPRPACAAQCTATMQRCPHCGQPGGPPPNGAPKIGAAAAAGPAAGANVWSRPLDTVKAPGNIATPSPPPGKGGSSTKKGQNGSASTKQKGSTSLKHAGSQSAAGKQGDWQCPSCNFKNFASRARCHRCSDPRPEGLAGTEPQHPGDWKCTKCLVPWGAKRRECPKCGEASPTEQRRQVMKPRWTAEQTTLRKQMIEHDDFDQPVRFVGGVDISFAKGDSVTACAALVVASFPDLKVVYRRFQMVEMTEPYIPGFLAFREVPHLEPLIAELRATRPELEPQVIMVDGNGSLHWRRFGLACHLGVQCGIPTIGVGKTLFTCDGIPSEEAVCSMVAQGPQERGAKVALIDRHNDLRGYAVLPTENVQNPIYVSAGHRVSLETAVSLVVKCSRRRIPEPIHLADLGSRDALRAAGYK